MKFVLASASPARLETLRRAGVEPEVVVSGVAEDTIVAPSSADLVEKLAELKALAVVDRVDGAALVLGCDSLLELDGRPLGKPGSADAAAQRWRELRGRAGALYTGHCLIDTGSGQQAARSVATTVRFADLTDAEIDAYCATGEPSAVAGGFTIDGLGGWFVDGVDGDHHNVVGLSLPALRVLLHELGYALSDIGYPSAAGSV